MFTTIKKGNLRILFRIADKSIWTSSTQSVKPKVSPAVIDELFSKDKYIPECKLFNSINEAIDFYLIKFIEKNSEFTLNPLAESFKCQYNSSKIEDGKQLYYIRHKLLHHIFNENVNKDLPSNEINHNRFRVKSERMKMAKIAFSSIEDENNYSKFISCLYSDNLNSHTGNGKHFFLPDDISEYLNNLFHHYLTLPKPRPDYIQFQHLEDFLGLLMTLNKIDRHQLKFKNMKVTFTYSLYEKFLAVLQDIARADIPLTIKEKKHFLYLKLLCSLQYKLDKPLIDKDNKDTVTDENSLIKEYRTIKSPDFSDISLFMKYSIKYKFQKLSIIVYEGLKKLEQQENYQDRFIIPGLLNYYAENKLLTQFENILADNIKYLTLDIRMANAILSILLLKLGDISNADLILNKLVNLSEENTKTRKKPGFQKKYVDKKDRSSKALQILDELRFYNGEYTSPLIKEIKINDDTISLFIKHLSNPNNMKFSLDESVFKNVISFKYRDENLLKLDPSGTRDTECALFLFDKVVHLLSLKLSNREIVIEEYNRLSHKLPSISLQDLNPQATDINGNDRIKIAVFADIFDGFIYYNYDAMRNIKEANDMKIIRSWCLESLQYLTKIFVNVYKEDSCMLFKKIMDAYFVVLNNGNYGKDDAVILQRLQEQRSFLEDEDVVNELKAMEINLKSGSRFKAFFTGSSINDHGYDPVTQSLDKFVFRDITGNPRKTWVHEYFKLGLVDDDSQYATNQLTEETDMINNGDSNTFFLENQFIDDSNRCFTFDQFFDIKHDNVDINDKEGLMYQKGMDLFLFIRQSKRFAYLLREHLYKEHPTDYKFFDDQLNRVKNSILTKLYKLNIEDLNQSQT